MRTRMYGGVRGRGLAAPIYSIYKLFGILTLIYCGGARNEKN